jgi:hypothetical protein
MTGGVLFVDRASRRVMLLNWQGTNIQLLPPDPISIFSEHLFSGGLGNTINQIAFATSPVMRLWFLQNDGTLVCCEYDDKYDIRGWWNFITDGIIASICIGQGILEDVLYMVVNRNGHYTIEQLTTPDWVSESGVGGLMPAVFTDASVYKYNATPFTSVSGLTNLNGKTVQMVGDGMYLGTAVVSAGAVTLPTGGAYPASYNTAVVGLAYASIMTSMPIEPGAPQDSGIGKVFTIPRVAIQSLQSLYYEVVGIVGGNPEISDFTVGQAAFPTLHTGMERSPVPSGFSYGSSVTIQSSKPLPCIITAIIPEVAGYE